jgi:HEAT repeat protein
MGNASGVELQVEERLRNVLRSYVFQPAHSPWWKAVLRDEQTSVYGRLCAAYFLVSDDVEARRFVTRQAHAKNLRHRYNAAKVVETRVRRGAAAVWGIDLLLELIASGALDGSGVTSTPPGDFPEGDRTDIMFSPVGDICWTLGALKPVRAVPTLIELLGRKPNIGGAAYALGEIGDARGAPVLMTILEHRTGYEDREVTALGKLKHLPAVPILLARLGHPRTTFSGLDVLEAQRILEALLAIGDKRAVPRIQAYLRGPHPKHAKAVARRVLIQLDDPDPVPGLVALLRSETYEPERADLLRALSKHADPRAIRAMDDVTTRSPSAFMRREAIRALGAIGNRAALLSLANALTARFANLTSEFGWKTPPTSFETFFPALITTTLEAATDQKLGADALAWKSWIESNVPE